MVIPILIRYRKNRANTDANTGIGASLLAHGLQIQLASYGTARKQVYIKCKRSHEPCRIFKSADELLVSARMSLAELLRVLTSYFCLCTITA